MFPFFVDDVPVPCGKCPACLVRRTNNWVFRIMQEERHSVSSLWITLTYDNYHLPISPNGFATLCKRDVQLFFKRYRKALGKDHPKIKYYACGEYGSKGQRPHYHLLIINGVDRCLASSWRDSEGVQIGDIYIDDRPLNSSAIGYTVGYMNKTKITGRYQRDDRVSEFALMSKKMGLSYLTPEVVAWHKADLSRNYVILPGGVKSALPRYFADRIYSDEDKEARIGDLEASVRKAAKLKYDDHVRKFGNADGFIKSQNEARHAAVINFQKKANGRLDL